MAFLAAAAPYITVATTALSAYSAVQAGNSQRAQAQAAAAQREKDANAAQVEAQQVASRERKRSQLVRSRALAVAGASGAGVSDPTITNILTDIDTQGEMSALNALWSGDYTARSLRAGAAASLREGDAAQTAGYLSGASTALSGSTSFYEKYGKRYGKGIG